MTTRTRVLSAFFVALALYVALPFSLAAQADDGGAPDGDELLRRADEAVYPRAFEAQMELANRRPGGRSLSMEFLITHEEESGTLLEISGEGRWAGMRMLTRGESLLLYNPTAGSSRPVRLTAAEGFYGSFFSNRDIAEPRYHQDYRAMRVTAETAQVAGPGPVLVYRVDAEATTPEAAYGSLTILLRASDALPLVVEYFARAGAHVKTMRVTEIRELAGRPRPTTYRMEPADQSGVYSTVRVISMTAYDDIDDSVFTEDHLTR